jgi:hypothetical protein
MRIFHGYYPFCLRVHRSEDPVLGLAWLRSRPDVFVSGSATGLTRVNRVCVGSGVDAYPSLSAASELADPSLIAYSPITERGLRSGDVIAEDTWQAFTKDLSSRPPPMEGHIKSTIMADFDSLTSVHVNSSDSAIVCSGYDKSVNVYDINTGKQVSSTGTASLPSWGVAVGLRTNQLSLDSLHCLIGCPCCADGAIPQGAPKAH